MAALASGAKPAHTVKPPNITTPPPKATKMVGISIRRRFSPSSDSEGGGMVTPLQGHWRRLGLPATARRSVQFALVATTPAEPHRAGRTSQAARRVAPQ